MSDGWRIPLSRPDIDAADKAAVLAVLETPTLSIGPEIDALEAEFSTRLHDLPTVAVSSGTAGLFMALRALGVSGGEVITPSFGFIGTVHAIRAAGAVPRFVDVSPETLCVTTEIVADAFHDDTRAVLPVDIFGTPAPVKEIVELAHARGVPVVDDACEALGAERRGRAVGTEADAGVFAFYPNKQMTMGEGGLVVARDEPLAASLRSWRNQGRGEGTFVFSGDGFNFRLTEMQAALGRSQLRRFDDFLARRTALAERYERLLADIPGLAVLPDVAPGDRRSWFVYPVFVEQPEWRDPVRAALAARGIQTAPYFPALHTLEPLASYPTSASLAVTEAVAARSFAIPFHNRLPAEHADEVAAALGSALSECGAGSETLSLQTLLANPA